MYIKSAETDFLNMVAGRLGSLLKPFCFDGGSGLDLARVEGFCGREGTLLDYVRGLSVYRGCAQPWIDRALLFDYLLSNYICYVEVGSKATGKGFATRSTALAEEWVSGKVQGVVDFKDISGGRMGVLWCREGKKGNTAVRSRGMLVVDDITICVPVCMQREFLGGLLGELRSGMVEFTYLKMDGSKRVLVTTFNEDILMREYGGCGILEFMLSAVRELNTAGGVTLGDKAYRGYISVPELGVSKYDMTGVRAINISHILGVRVVDDYDRTYVDVNFARVLDVFGEYIDRLYSVGDYSGIEFAFFGVLGRRVSGRDYTVVCALLDELRALFSKEKFSPKIIYDYLRKVGEVS